MKKRFLYIFALLGLNVAVTVSCIKEEWGVGNVNQTTNQNQDGWNKNKTIQVYYLTTLADKGVYNIAPVSDFFNSKGKACGLGVVDRTDVQMNLYNVSTDLAFSTARFSCYALNRMISEGGSTAFEGSTILFNHKINSEYSFKVTDDCFLKYVPVQVASIAADPILIPVPFTTVRFDSKKQIDAAEMAFKTLSGNAYEGLVIGTVKTDLLEPLKAAAERITDYTFTEVTKNADTEYSIFMLGKKTWVLREMTKTSVDSDLNAFCLSIEASVE
ncbi:hypothetical protein AB9N12_13235 [Bacteroides sp. AN502(2024)]|uniref:hypothetical protein n=1 Tax=Bacteroides sp. AN502(2024) TaxID=3160599 RepID=UPI00351278AB